MESMSEPKPEVFDESTEPCICEECEAAVSPRAYLIQLLDYAVQNLDITSSEDETEKDKQKSRAHEGIPPGKCFHGSSAQQCGSMYKGVLRPYAQHLLQEQ